MLSRKYYQQIADVVANAAMICQEVDDAETYSFIRDQVAYPLADIFGDDNPNFDTSRFIAACNVSERMRV